MLNTDQIQNWRKKMETKSITVVYKWTAMPGKLNELTGIYKGVTDAMKANEPGALEVQVYVSEEENALYVRDEFADADAMGFHLSETAGPHFPSLLEVATPGAFYFFGDVPAEMQQAAKGMGLAAEFAGNVTGFSR
jgi:quinol monooxygenase YgiN